MLIVVLCAWRPWHGKTHGDWPRVDNGEPGFTLCEIGLRVCDCVSGRASSWRAQRQRDGHVYLKLGIHLYN